MRKLLLLLVFALPLCAMRIPPPPVEPLAKTLERAASGLPEPSNSRIPLSYLRFPRPIKAHGAANTSRNFFFGKKSWKKQLSEQALRSKPTKVPKSALQENVSSLDALFLIGGLFATLLYPFFLGGSIYTLIVWIAGWSFSWGMFALVGGGTLLLLLLTWILLVAFNR